MSETYLLVLAIILMCVVFVFMIKAKKKSRGSRAEEQSAASEPQRNGGATRVLPVGMLISKTGSMRGMVFAIEPDGLKIGRDKSKNQIVIESEIVSREHAWVGLEDGKVVIKDLQSRNGTYINALESNRVSREILKDGDVIYIGKDGVESFKYKAG